MTIREGHGSHKGTETAQSLGISISGTVGFAGGGARLDLLDLEARRVVLSPLRVSGPRFDLLLRRISVHAVGNRDGEHNRRDVFSAGRRSSRIVPLVPLKV